MKLFLLTFLFLSSYFVNAQAYLMGSQYENEIQSSNKDNTASVNAHPAFMNTKNVNELEGAPNHLEDYFDTFCKKVEQKDYVQIAYFMDGAQQFNGNENKIEEYINNFWCGYEEGKKYNGTICTSTEEIKKIDVISHKQLGDKTILIKHKLSTTSNKKIIVELVMQLTSSNPKFIGTM